MATACPLTRPRDKTTDFPCGPGSTIGHYELVNSNTSEFTGLTTVESVNAADMANKIVSELNAAADSKNKSQKDGTFAGIGDKAEVDQKIIVSDKTRTEIEQKIKMTLNTYIAQKTVISQTHENISLIEPCVAIGSGPVAVNNINFMKAIATDLTTAATNAIMASEEYKKVATSLVGSQDVSSRDTFGQIADLGKALVGGLTSLGLGWFFVVGAVLIGLIFFLPAILRSVGSVNVRGRGMRFERRGSDDR